MRRLSITHVMRAPIVGGSELETLAITEALPEFDHRVVFPARFAGWGPSIRGRFRVPVEPVADLCASLDRLTDGIVHLQFPFLRVDVPCGHDSVLELERLPGVPVVFTVHAAVNVPVLPDLHYVFHSAGLAQRFAALVPAMHRTRCPSLVRVPDVVPARDRTRPLRILWISRNEDAKFHPELPAIVAAALAQEPRVEFRFVGTCDHAPPPRHPRVHVTPCPAPDLPGEYAAADVFWHFPHPLLEETWCRTVTEAMAYGLPCVVAAHGAMAEQVRDGVHGRVVAEPAACVAALLSLVRLPSAVRAELGAAARTEAIGFEQQCLATWRDLYTRLGTR